MRRVATATYERLPAWAQDLALTGYGALLDRERYGGRFREYQAFLARSEWQSREELQAYQDRRLRALVTHAYETVPYYRRVWDECGVRPEVIQGTADLGKLPLLTRDDVRVFFDELRSRSFPRARLRTGHTSGTTGTPLTVGYDPDTVWFTYAVFDRHYRWAGIRLGRGGDRVAVARGNVVVPLYRKQPPFWRRNRWHNQLLLSSFHLSKDNLPAYFEELERFKPAVLDGYPSTLYVLARFLERQNRTFPVRAVISSSETLYDFQRAVIEERFACRVFDYYAMAERVVFSGECEAHSGHHVSMEYGVAEIVDEGGQPVPEGTAGRLVGTTLHNMAMPLIRYVTSDITALKAGACRCGRGLHLMDDVTTKAEDLLTLPDGRVISPSVLTHPFKPLDCIEGSQIVQTAPDKVTVRIVPRAEYETRHTEHLLRELKARLGKGVEIEVQMVDGLERSHCGKFKWVVSHVPLGI